MNAPVPLRPDRGMLERETRRSIVRGITAMALSAGDRNAAGDLRQRAWPNDAQADRIIRSAVSPTSTSSFPAITTATAMQALGPQSAEPH